MSPVVDSPILHIKDHGQSLWIDNLSRDMLRNGELQRLMRDRDIRGITSNPVILQKAIAGNQLYDPDIEAGIRSGHPVSDIYEAIVFEDIRTACDQLLSVYNATEGVDGYVSLEVPPSLAHNAQSTLREARRYWQAIQRPNLMIKIPGTPEGMLAVKQAIAEGINVNVTLLFSVQSYLDATWAYIRGLEIRAEAGHDIHDVASVASFFLSRIDTLVDGMVDQLMVQTDDPAHKANLAAVKGKIAIANAKHAYQKYQEIITHPRWQALLAKGARPQRLLWASTGTKNPAYSDVLYVDELIGPNTVNTLPPDTVEACADHCHIASRITTHVEEAIALLDTLPELGIDLDAVMAILLQDGLDKFVQPFNALMDTLVMKVRHLSPV